MESNEKKPQVFIKTAEEKECIDFSIVLPQNCATAAAKQALMIAYEHIVRVEFEEFKKQQEAKPEPVAAEVVS
jgi:hypothetical protein